MDRELMRHFKMSGKPCYNKYSIIESHCLSEGVGKGTEGAAQAGFPHGIYRALEGRNKTESPISFVFPVRRGCVQTQRISVASAAWGMLFHESAPCAGLRVYSGPAANLHDKDLFHDDAV
jgi:hypothetical protein